MRWLPRWQVHGGACGRVVSCAAAVVLATFGLVTVASATEDAAPACLVARTDPLFADFETRREEWSQRYAARHDDFRAKFMVHADAVSRCVERALRRDLTANSRTSFGIHVTARGEVAHVAMLGANHNDHLYAACVARSICGLALEPSAQPGEEILLFHFNMRRRQHAHERPWSLDRRLRQ